MGNILLFLPSHRDCSPLKGKEGSGRWQPCHRKSGILTANLPWILNETPGQAFPSLLIYKMLNLASEEMPHCFQRGLIRLVTICLLVQNIYIQKSNFLKLFKSSPLPLSFHIPFHLGKSCNAEDSQNWTLNVVFSANFIWISNEHIPVIYFELLQKKKKKDILLFQTE